MYAYSFSVYRSFSPPKALPNLDTHTPDETVDLKHFDVQIKKAALLIGRLVGEWDPIDTGDIPEGTRISDRLPTQAWHALFRVVCMPKGSPVIWLWLFPGLSTPEAWIHLQQAAISFSIKSLLGVMYIISGWNNTSDILNIWKSQDITSPYHGAGEEFHIGLPDGVFSLCK